MNNSAFVEVEGDKESTTKVATLTTQAAPSVDNVDENTVEGNAGGGHGHMTSDHPTS